MMQLRLRFRHKEKGQLLELYANYAGSCPINVVLYGNMHRIIILTARGSFLRLGTQGRVVLYGMQACNIGFVTEHGQWIPYHIILHPDDVIIMKHFRVTGPLWGESTGHQWIPSQRPVTRSIAVFIDLYLNKRLSKHSRRRWCHCNG